MDSFVVLVKIIFTLSLFHCTHTQGNCSAGSFFSTVSNSCELCEPGTYQPDSNTLFCIKCSGALSTTSNGATSATDCIANCSAGYFYSTETRQCTICPVGSFAAEGLLPDNRVRTACETCLTGYTTSFEGATKENDCYLNTDCAAGYFRESGSCKPCPRGFYRPLSAATCIHCGDQMTTAQEASTSQSQCISETGGQQCGAGQYVSSGACVQCPLNTYQSQPDQSSCVSCAEGLVTLQRGSTAPEQCVQPGVGSCPPGNFLWGNVECRQCGIGSYQNQSNQVGCTSCRLGLTTRKTGATSIDDCVAPCFPGSYIQPSGDCALCPRGQFQHQNDRNTCLQCPAGTTTPEPGAKHVDACVVPCELGEQYTQGGCTPCPVGQYRDTQLERTCIRCPQGYTTPTTGSTKISDCQPLCPAGNYLSSNGNCEACALGTYQPLESQSSCLQCPGGLTTRKVNATDIRDCVVICQAGHYPSGTSCRPCELGTYQNLSDQPQCLKCPSGLTTRQTGALNQDSCVESCPAGSYVRGTECVLCPQGTYQFEPDKTQCISCTDGYTTPNEGASDGTQCIIICNSGSFLFEGVCSECPIGQVQPVPGQERCISCPVNQTTLQSGSRLASDCVDICEPGYVLQSRVCTACGLGFYQPEAGKLACLSCPQGQSTVNIATKSEEDCVEICRPGLFNSERTCTPCPVNTYQPEQGRDSCLNCPNDRRTRETGASSVEQCIELCAAGSFWNSSSEQCELCPVGSYTTGSGFVSCTSCPNDFSTRTSGADSRDLCLEFCAAGSFLEAAGACEQCPVGTYKASAGYGACLSCPGSSSTLRAGATSSQDCIIMCAAGTYRGAVECLPCALGYYREDGSDQTSCSQCPAGQTTVNEGATSAAQCYLDCAVGYEPEEDTCAACERGYYKDKSGASSCTVCLPGSTTEGVASIALAACSLPDCQPGTYIFGTVCKPCETGQYQSRKWQTRCEVCPQFHTTTRANATSSSDCIFWCGVGRTPTADRTSCVECAVGTYKAAEGTAACVSCPEGTLTVSAGATSQEQCSVPICQAGSFLDTRSVSCSICQQGYYQDEVGQTSCKQCPPGTTTYPNAQGQIISTSVGDCLDTNVCNTDRHDCHSNANCEPTGQYTFRCTCKAGFNGDGRTCIHLCEWTPAYCQNGGTCRRTIDNEPICTCTSDYEDARCSTKTGGLSETTVIIIGAVGGAVGLAILIVLIWCCCTCVARRQKAEPLQPLATVQPQQIMQHAPLPALQRPPPAQPPQTVVQQPPQPVVQQPPPVFHMTTSTNPAAAAAPITQPAPTKTLIIGKPSQPIVTRTPPPAVLRTSPKVTRTPPLTNSTPPTGSKSSVFTRDSSTPSLRPLTVFVDKQAAKKADAPEEPLYAEADALPLEEPSPPPGVLDNGIYANANPKLVPQQSNSTGVGAVFKPKAN